VELQGHRGARGLHPENTLEGFEEALSIGVTTLEMDLGVTRDGVIVVHHDEELHPDIARGPEGTWIAPPRPLLRELSWAELSGHEVGRLRPESPTRARFPEQQGRDGVGVPRFPDVLAMAEERSGGRILYNVETKLTPTRPEATLAPDAFVDAVLAVLRGAGVTDRTTIQSFDWRTLRRVHKLSPEITTACLTEEATVRGSWQGASPWHAGHDVADHDGSVPRLVAAAGCAIWSPDFQDLDAGQVALAHELGLRVIPWTVNEPEDLAAVLKLGVDGIISDYPDRAREALAERGHSLPARFPLP